MRFRDRLARAYFNSVYNPLYDASTARLSRYVEAQNALATALVPEPGMRVLCAGLGTGNELTALREHEPALEVVGIDLSRAAMKRAWRKPAGHARGTSLLLMDARLLAFSAEAFDRVLCYHVLDFVAKAGDVTGEFMRVLKPGGRFVISFPAGNEGPGLGATLLSHGLEGSRQSIRMRASRVLRTVLAGLIYLPLLLRSHPTVYSPDNIESLLRSQGAVDIAIESDPVYRDHIACGVKRRGGN